MKNILFSLFALSVLSLYGSGIQAMDQKITVEFQIKEVAAGVRHCSMYILGKSENPEHVGSIGINQGKTLDIFTSSVFDAVDRSSLPSTIVRLMTVIGKIKTKQSLDKVVMLGDLHIAIAYRGKGFAQQLLDKACQYCFDEGATLIALIPDPFEYENGTQKCLESSPDYEIKKQRLIQLYQKCGFSIDKADATLFMYRNLE